MARAPRINSAGELRAACGFILRQQESLAECLTWRDAATRDVAEAVVPLPLHDYAAVASHAKAADVAIILRHLDARLAELRRALEELDLARPSADDLDIVLPRRGARVFVPTCIDDAWRRTKVSAITLVEAYGSPAQLDLLNEIRRRHPIGEEATVVVGKAERKPEEAAESAADTPRAAVLLVDDEPDILDSLATYIETAMPGIKVLTAASGQAAIEVLTEQPVALIISDVRMPGMDGPTFLEHAEKIQPGVRRVLLTAYPAVSAKAQATAEAVLRKPIALQELLDRLKDATENPGR